MGLLQRKPGSAKLAKWLEEEELPQLPGTALEALDLLRDEQASNVDIAAPLERDAKLSVQLLRLVNSAAFGLHQPAEDVPRAVQLIGRSALETMLIAAAVTEAMPSASVDGFDAAHFWEQASRRASLAGVLAERLVPEERSLCWTAVLLSDLAIPLLVDRLGKKYVALLERVQAGEGLLHELEHEAYGWDHAEVAALLCGRWRLPERLVEAIGSHHDAESRALLPVVLVARLRDAELDAPESIDCGALLAAVGGAAIEAELLQELLVEALEKGSE